MKRIAIELCGLSRTYRDTAFSLLENLIIPNEMEGYAVDVFIHTWTESDSSDVVRHNPKGKARTKQISNRDFAEIAARYNPVKLLIDKPLNVSKELILQEQLKPFVRSYSSIVSCFFSRYRVNELRRDYTQRTGVHYDYVLLTRMDILFLKPFRLNDFLNTFSRYGCCVPPDTVFTASSPFKRGYAETDYLRCNTDLILFGSERTMDTICGFYKELTTGRITPDFIIKELFGMEALWAIYWREKWIQSALLSFFEGPDYVIVRSHNNNSDGNTQTDSTTKTQSYKLRRNLRSAGEYFHPLFNWCFEPIAMGFYGFAILKKTVRTFLAAW